MGFTGGFTYKGKRYPKLPFEILKAYDNDAKCVVTYRRNIGDHIEEYDLSKVDPEKMPYADVVIGGFPCQDFSSCGPKRGLSSKRGKLYQALIVYMKHHKPKVVVETPGQGAFALGCTHIDERALQRFRSFAGRRMRAFGNEHLAYGDPRGSRELRAAIADHLLSTRGLRCDPDQIMLTSGTQHALRIVLGAILRPGDQIWCEDPGYPAARSAIGHCGLRPVSVPVDVSGMIVAKGRALAPSAGAAYVTPSHQFPLGMPMSHARREALLAWAARRNAMIIEDDYDSEFRFGGRPLETLQSLELGRRNGAGRVIYVGSFSKSLVPALRLGFLIAPPPLQAPLRAACHLGGWCGQWPVQGALATMIDRGLLGRHVRKMRRIYAERHDRILHALTADFSGWLVPQRSVTGLHITATFLSGSLAFERDLTERALASGLHVERLSTYYATRRRKAGLVLGYGAIPTAQIASGLALLRDCFVRIQ